MSEEESKKDLYEIYNLVKKSCLSHQKKKVILRSLLVEEEWSWKVIAISHEAVVAYVKNRFEKITNKLVRHHPIAYAETADKCCLIRKT